MIKLDTRALTTPFAHIDAGDTFAGGDDNYYIKIQTVAKTKNYECAGTYNAVCLTDGSLALVAENQLVALVNIEAVVVP